jgi:hypothetical protein
MEVKHINKMKIIGLKLKNGRMKIIINIIEIFDIIKNYEII